MRMIIQKIAKKTDLPEEKVSQVLLAITEQVKEDFPLLANVMELTLGEKNFLKKKSIIIDLPENQFIYN